MKGVRNMKESKHQPDTYETALEKIEQIIEAIDPDEEVNVKDITCRIKLADCNTELTEATIMLLNKYGIDYKE
jgi:hypothetical protein